MEHSKSSSKRDIYSDTVLPQETRKISSKQHKLLSKGIRKTTKPKISRRKEIINIREEVNKIETKKRKKPSRKDQ